MLLDALGRYGGGCCMLEAGRQPLQQESQQIRVGNGERAAMIEFCCASMKTKLLVTSPHLQAEGQRSCITKVAYGGP